MIELISFFVLLVLSLLVVRVAGVMLTMTGMSEDAARFQARSAFTGTGFTTKEAETITGHPVRRRIISNLMLIGNIGFVTILSSLILSFVGSRNNEEIIIRFAVIGGGLIFLTLITRSRLFNRLLMKIVRFFLRRWTKVYAKDYDSLLNLSGEYEVSNVTVNDGSWLADKTLEELELTEEGVLVLGIKRPDGYYIGTPRGSALIYAGDQIILYGREPVIRALGDRPTGSDGDEAHQKEADSQRQMEGRTATVSKLPKIKEVPGRLFGIFKTQKKK